jgi:hypothetical protein
MLARTVADILVVVHLMFIVFVVFGGLLVLRWPRVAWAHVPCAAYGALIEFVGWVCPLTPLEQRLRIAAGGQGYQGGFIDHYIMPLVYPPGLTRDLQVWLGLGVLVINVGVYAWLLARWLRRRRRSDRGGR